MRNTSRLNIRQTIGREQVMGKQAWSHTCRDERRHWWHGPRANVDLEGYRKMEQLEGHGRGLIGMDLIWVGMI